MSNFKKMTVNPTSLKEEMADWIDDYFGRHNYGVTFGDGKFYQPIQILIAEKSLKESNNENKNNTDI